MTAMDARKFGAFLAQRRKAGGMTQQELAEKINVTDKAVSRWERGLGFPDIGTLEPLAAALGVTLVELMRAQAEPQPVTQESAQAAVSETIALAQQKHGEELHLQMCAAAAGCVFLAAAAVLSFGLRSIVGSLFCFGGLAAALCAQLWGERQQEPQQRQAAKIIAICGFGTAAIGGISLVPTILLERYSDFLLLGALVILFFGLLRQTVSDFVHRSSGRRMRFALAAGLAAVLIAGASAGMQFRRIDSNAEKARIHAAQQYAAARVLSDCGITHTDIIGTVTVQDQDAAGGKEIIGAAFCYRDPETGQTRYYGYGLQVNGEFVISVQQQSEALGRQLYETQAVTPG